MKNFKLHFHEKYSFSRWKKNSAYYIGHVHSIKMILELWGCKPWTAKIIENIGNLISEDVNAPPKIGTKVVIPN